MTSDTDAPSEKEIHNLWCDITRSSRYHMLRMGYYDLWHRSINGLSILFGSATFVMLIAQWDQLIGLGSLFLLTALNTADLVFGFANKARLHSDLRRRFIRVQSEVETNDITRDLYRSIKRDILEIEADEPTVLRALDTTCHNHVCKALGPDYEDDICLIPWWMRATKQLISWDCTNLETIGSKKKSADKPDGKN